MLVIVNSKYCGFFIGSAGWQSVSVDGVEQQEVGHPVGW